MRILIANKRKIPVFLYGGTERVIWDLGRSLVEMGHEVTFLVEEGSYCDFAQTIPIRRNIPLAEQIPKNIDIAHFNFNLNGEELDFPHIVTEHGNHTSQSPMSLNTVFLTENHAIRHNSTVYVYNGMDWRNYGPVDLKNHRNHYHFLGKTSRPDKNVQAAIRIASKSNIQLAVLGGYRFNSPNIINFTWNRLINFYGMVGGERKFDLLNRSKGLIFPVKWHEPFGLAIIESLYFGCPVFGSLYGSLPELIPSQYGYLSNHENNLIDAINNMSFNRRECHEYARENFNSDRMALGYLEKYKKVLDGESLHRTAPRIIGKCDNLAWNV